MDPNQQTQPNQTEALAQSNPQQPVNKVPSSKNKLKWIILAIIFLFAIGSEAYFLNVKTRKISPLNQQKTINDIIPITKPTQSQTAKTQPTPEIRSINNAFNFLADKDLNITFEYPITWGDPHFWWDGMDADHLYSKVIIFPNIGRAGNSGVAFSAINPLSQPPGRGTYWGDSGYKLKSEEDFQNLCPEESDSCKIYKNKNGITIIKKYESVGTEGGINDFKSNQYYIHNSNSQYSSIVISDERFDKDIVPNAEKEIGNLVNSLRFIK
jgi:hypothetical protein